ncbi:MAG: RICIN domain-containing protein, partial [Oscillospiraceae bacterium]|nr:RICIN domain-containing protein [Oscillospiraceae bacterium]
GALAATGPAEYSAIVTVNDGTLDVGISKGDKAFGGYISGLEITTPPTPKYKFDFGDGNVQSGFEAVRSSTAFSAKTGYGFAGSQSGMTRGPGGVAAGMENLYVDQIQGETDFRTILPNGTYCVTVYYGSWNESFGTRFNIEGVDSGALAATGPAEYSAIVTVNDGILDVGISKGDKAYGGYISGLEITTPPTPKYKFDFGDGNVQSGFEAVRSSTVYSAKAGYGFEGSAPGGMTRAPGGIAAGMENLYGDQLNGNGHFKANIPNGSYNVAIYYGSWNESFGTKYIVEGIETEALASTTAAVTAVPVEITDGMLDVVIEAGDKAYGGYISGLEILPIPAPTYKFDFGDGDVQSGYAAVKSTTAYSPYTGYGFSGTLPAAMTRGPGNVPSGFDNLYGDQINGTAKFMANIPNGRYDVTVYYGSWNTGFGTSYIIEGTQSGPLFATDAAKYIARVDVKDGMLNVDINMGEQKYGGYISGLEIAPASSDPLPTPTPASTPEPTIEPTQEPTPEPTAEPTIEPTPEPTAEPTIEPMPEPTDEPAPEPTDEPTAEPTDEPAPEPTDEPTTEPDDSEYANIPEGVYSFKSVLSGKYLDVANGSSKNGANLQQFTGNGETAQQFKLVKASDGSYKILTGCSNYKQAVDVSGYSQEDGANILTWEQGSGPNQLFRFKKESDGSYAVLTKMTDFTSALDIYNMSKDNGANICQWTYWGGSGQRWFIEPVKETPAPTPDPYAAVSEGVYRMKNVNSGKYLDVMYGIFDDGANIQQYEANGATAQEFKIVPAGNGYYKILTRCSNYKQALDVDGGTADNGANIQTWSDNSKDSQLFKFIKESDGSYGILTKSSELKASLDVFEVSKNNGANVCQWTYNKGTGQRWFLEEVK